MGIRVKGNFVFYLVKDKLRDLFFLNFHNIELQYLSVVILRSVVAVD